MRCTYVLIRLQGTNRLRIVSLAQAARLSTVFGEREFVEAGGLISYGPNIPDLFRRAAELVDKILSGSNSGDISVEHQNKFDVMINFKAEKMLGLYLQTGRHGRSQTAV